MPKKIIVIGAGENSAVITNILKEQYTVAGFLDDHVKNNDILGPISMYKKYLQSHLFFITIGNNCIRSELFKKIKNGGGIFVNAIHKTAFLEQSIELGTNIFIGARSYININTRIDNHVFINNCCIIEHDNTILSGAHITPGVITGGGTKVGARTFIGLGSIINDHITIGDDTIIGSGSVVITDIASSVLVAGIPAKIVKKL